MYDPDNVVEKELQEQIKDEILCPLCEMIYDNPYQCNNENCQKSFCKDSCASQLKNCPNCGIESNFIQDKRTIKFLDKFTFQCPNKNNGCNEKPTQSNINIHMEKCKFGLIIPDDQDNKKKGNIEDVIYDQKFNNDFKSIDMNNRVIKNDEKDSINNEMNRLKEEAQAMNDRIKEEAYARNIALELNSEKSNNHHHHHERGHHRHRDRDHPHHHHHHERGHHRHGHHHRHENHNQNLDIDQIKEEAQAINESIMKKFNDDKEEAQNIHQKRNNRRK